MRTRTLCIFMALVAIAVGTSQLTAGAILNWPWWLLVIDTAAVVIAGGFVLHASEMSDP